MLIFALQRYTKIKNNVQFCCYLDKTEIYGFNALLP